MAGVSGARAPTSNMLWFSGPDFPLQIIMEKVWNSDTWHSFDGHEILWRAHAPTKLAELLLEEVLN